MQWQDSGILVEAHTFGETDVVATFLTREHGLAGGLVRGGVSRRQKPFLQIGNSFTLTWKSRLEEQLGFFSFDPVELVGGDMFDSRIKIMLLSCVCNTIYNSLASLQANGRIYEMTRALVGVLRTCDDEFELRKKYMEWERALLRELGFEMRLDVCNATGATADLCYISPVTGHAVCRSAGEPYRAKMLAMPRIWGRDFDGVASIGDVNEALDILEYFFNARVYSEHRREAPFVRCELTGRLRRAA